MPCPSCKDLDLNNKTPAYRPGDFHTYAYELYEANEAGCRICSVIWRAVLHFAEKEQWETLLNPLCKVDISLASPPDGPLSVMCWEEPTWMDVEFITLPGLPVSWASPFKPAAVVGKTSDSPACFSRIKSWIAECEANHPDCKSADMVQLPTRVIDVNPTPHGLRPFLVESNGLTGRYVALSYVWGTALPLKMTKATLEPFKSGIPWSSIPKTLQDAMTITHRLGLRYIWIDALTIIQDDAQDWKTEAVKMASVYGNAYLTISATLSTDCHAGIFSPRTIAAHHVQVWPLGVEQRPTEVTNPDSLSDFAIYARSGWSRGTAHYRLQKRGWTLQELVLSRRVVQYASQELIYHCRTARATESAPTFVLPSPKDKNNNNSYNSALLKPTPFPLSPLTPAMRDQLLALWRTLIQNYTTRFLTFPSDKLPAIEGIARAFQASGLGPYHAGLWEADLLVGLTWYSKATFPRGGWRPTHYRPKDGGRAPSWSWASIEGEVGWSLEENRQGHLRAPLARCQVLSVSNTELVVRAPVVAGVLEKNCACLPPKTELRPGEMSYDSGFGELVVAGHTDKSVLTDVIDTSLMHPGIDGPVGLVKTPADVICLLLGVQEPGKHTHWVSALVLAPVEGRDGVYERVGVSTMLSAKCFKGAEEREVRIV